MPRKKTKRAAEELLRVAKRHDDRARLEEIQFSVSYLELFGYLTRAVLEHVTLDDVLKAVKKFQGWFGLKRDGVVGPKTLRAMMEPRCGCPDVVDEDNPDHAGYAALMRFARDRQNLQKWNKKGLKYYVDSHVDGVPKSRQADIYAGAWKAWDDHCGIRIAETRSRSQADLVLDTGRGKRSNFDGSGGTLAWAFLPNGNDRQLMMRFDLDETWVTSPQERGILLFNVACHEFGHMLGLTHSKRKGALMAPHYNPQVATPQWNDDVPRVQARYGKNTDRPTPQPPVPPSDGEVFHVTCKELQVEDYTLYANK